MGLYINIEVTFRPINKVFQETLKKPYNGISIAAWGRQRSGKKKKKTATPSLTSYELADRLVGVVGRRLISFT